LNGSASATKVREEKEISQKNISDDEDEDEIEEGKNEE